MTCQSPSGLRILECVSNSSTRDHHCGPSPHSGGPPLVTICGVDQSTLGQSSPHTLLCRPSCFSQGQRRLSLWGPCPGRESCSVDRPQAAAPASGTQLFPNSASPLPGTQPPGSVSKPRRKAPLQPAGRHRGGSWPARAHIPPSAHSPASSPGATGFLSRGPQRGSWASAGGGSLLPVQPHQAIATLGSVGVAGDAPNPEWLQSLRKISCLTFTPAACSSQNLSCTPSGKPC